MLLFIAETEAEEEVSVRQRHITGLNDSSVVITANDSSVVITARVLTATIASHSLRSE